MSPPTSTPRPPGSRQQIRAAAQKAEQHDSDVLDRLDSIYERQQMADIVVKGLAEDVQNLRQDLRGLREKDNDNERLIQKLAESVGEQTKSFTASLATETAAREKSQRAFTEALDSSQKASLDALQKALLLTLAQKLGNWLLTMAVGALFIGASWFWTKH